jgi:molybdenum cofactor guanylyltransferase
MGRDKAMIEVTGVPLLRRVYNAVAASPAIDRVCIITPWPEQYRSILPAHCQFILERAPDQGPLRAFAQGLTVVSSEWVLLLACDLPNVSTLAISDWIDGLPSIDSHSIAYLPRNPNKGWEPLSGFYRQSCSDVLSTYLNRGGKSFQDWLKLEIVTELAIADPRWLVNCNTPADLASISPEI